MKPKLKQIKSEDVFCLESKNKQWIVYYSEEAERIVLEYVDIMTLGKIKDLQKDPEAIWLEIESYYGE